MTPSVSSREFVSLSAYLYNTICVLKTKAQYFMNRDKTERLPLSLIERRKCHYFSRTNMYNVSWIMLHTSFNCLRLGDYIKVNWENGSPKITLTCCWILLLFSNVKEDTVLETKYCFWHTKLSEPDYFDVFIFENALHFEFCFGYAKI